MDRELYLVSPQEAEADDYAWKLRTCIYGLDDASWAWYLRDQEELSKFRTKTSKYDPAILLWHFIGQLRGLISISVGEEMSFSLSTLLALFAQFF